MTLICMCVSLRPSARPSSARRKRSVEAQEHQDDYQSLPMDIEEEEEYGLLIL